MLLSVQGQPSLDVAELPRPEQAARGLGKDRLPPEKDRNDRDFRRERRVSRIDAIVSRYQTRLSRVERRRLAESIERESRLHGFEPELVLAVIFTESTFRHWAVSKVGAVGLMQIYPTTGRELIETNEMTWTGVDRLFDPVLNIRLGIQYLKRLEERFGDLELALVAYNYGPTRVRRWLNRDHPIPKRYARRVLDHLDRFRSELSHHPSMVYAEGRTSEDSGSVPAELTSYPAAEIPRDL